MDFSTNRLDGASTDLARVTMPLVELMAKGRLSWADREKIAKAILECVRNYDELEKERLQFSSPTLAMTAEKSPAEAKELAINKHAHNFCQCTDCYDRRKSASNENKLTCADCDAPYGEDGWCDVIIPDETWNSIANGAGILCFRCMTKRLIAAGYDNAPVIVASGPYCDANEEWRLRGWDHGYKVGFSEAQDKCRPASPGPE